MAKARQKRDAKGTDDTHKQAHDSTLTMDQVTIYDLEHTTGIGGFNMVL